MKTIRFSTIKKAGMIIAVIAALVMALTACVPQERPDREAAPAPAPNSGTGEAVAAQPDNATVPPDVLALFAGLVDAEEPWLREDGAALFGFEGDKLVAYKGGVLHDEPEACYYEPVEPFAEFPAELGERARSSLCAYMHRCLGTEVRDEAALQMFGYIGKNCVVFMNEQHHGAQAAALFYTPDGNEWTELLPNEAAPYELTGGCVLSDSTAILCYCNNRLKDDPQELIVMRTEDGGRTWEDIGLVIPQELAEQPVQPIRALSPVFDGEHGVMVLTYQVYNREKGEAEGRTSWFETADGGRTWTFHLGADREI